MESASLLDSPARTPDPTGEDGVDGLPGSAGPSQDASGPQPKKRRRRRVRRPRGYLKLERELWADGVLHIAGVDEAGRGPLAGPVFAAAVVLPPRLILRGIDDSKLLRAAVRERLAVKIQKRALAWAVAAASTREVDRLNILRASHVAMRRALARLGLEPQHVVVDGLAVPDLAPCCTPVVDGDRLVHAVACASILAKVYRDRLMHRLAGRYPGYGWQTNVGYATQEHRDAIAELGVTPHHRMSFQPNQLALDLFGDGEPGDEATNQEAPCTPST
jgi:ribonuclease HII